MPGIVHQPYRGADPCLLQQMKPLAQRIQTPKIDTEKQLERALAQQAGQLLACVFRGYAQGRIPGGLKGRSQLPGEQVALPAWQQDGRLHWGRPLGKQQRGLHNSQSRAPKRWIMLQRWAICDNARLPDQVRVYGVQPVPFLRDGKGALAQEFRAFYVIDFAGALHRRFSGDRPQPQQQRRAGRAASQNFILFQPLGQGPLSAQLINDAAAFRAL